MTVREMLATKAAAKAKAEGILNSVASASRKMTDVEEKDFNDCVAEVARIEDLVTKQGVVASWSNTIQKPVVDSPRNTRVAVAASDDYKSAFYAMARGNAVAPEFLATLSEGAGGGGYLVPVSLDQVIQQKAALQSCMRRVSRVITTTSDRNFAVEGDLTVAEWTLEGDPLPETTPTFDRVTIKAYKMGAIAKVDNELLYDSAFNLEGELGSQFGRAFGILEEAAFIKGNGSDKPTGITTVAPIGVHVSSPSAISGDEIIELYHSLNPAYRATASFIVNDSTALLIRKLKFMISSDQVGYMWQQSLRDGEPDRLLGRPVNISAQMPVVAASAVSVLFGDYSEAYVIADRVPRTFQRLVELYAANDRTGFRATQRTDGNLVKAEAVTALRHNS